LAGLDAEDDDVTTIQDSFAETINHGDYAPYPNKLVSQPAIPGVFSISLMVLLAHAP
jgi:hypothetical protein